MQFVGFFIFLHIVSSVTFAQNLCEREQKESSFLQLSESSCQSQKESARCQNLYKKIKESGDDPDEKALRCDIDSDLKTSEKLMVSYIGCLHGGVVDGILSPVKDLATFLGETAARFVISAKEGSEREKQCNQNPKIKWKIYETYNSSVPKILKVPVPSNIESHSCAWLDTQLYHDRNAKLRSVSKSIDYKYYRNEKNISSAEKEYFDWKFKKEDLARSNDYSLIEIADQYLEKYDVQIDCYNLAARSALRCEALFNIVTMGTGAKASLQALAGLRFNQINKLSKLEVIPISRQLESAEETSMTLKFLGSCGANKVCEKNVLINREFINHIKPHQGWDADQKNYFSQILENYQSGKIKTEKDIDYWLNGYNQKNAKAGLVHPSEVARPFRAKKETSLFPEGVTPDDVLQSFQTKNVEKINLNQNLDELYEYYRVNHNGDRYDVVICKKDCHIKNPDRTIKENEVLSLYPICGKNIKRLVSSGTAKKILRNQPQSLSEADFLEAVPCED